MRNHSSSSQQQQQHRNHSAFSAPRSSAASPRDYHPQPFDQYVRGRSVEEKLSAMRTQQRSFEESLEDGDLPSLQQRKHHLPNNHHSKNMGGRLVNGQRTTTRPLSPPSQAGLIPGVGAGVAGAALPPAERTKQQQFWNQFETEGAAEPDNDDDRDNEEIPDDERLDRKLKLKSKSVPKKKDDASDMSSAGDPSTVDTAEYYPDQGGNICTQTLNAIGDICGGTAPLENSSGVRTSARYGQKPDAPEGCSHRSAAHLRRHHDAEEEHTAIEVEFVEPEPVEEALTTDKRKNAYLAAMARTAKEDFQNKRDDAPAAVDRGSARSYGAPASGISTAESVAPSVASSAAGRSAMSTGASVSSDVYNRFTPSDKRKFLKLINNGLTPVEASEQVLQERRLKNGDKGGIKLGAEKSPSSTPKARGLAFWKRSPPHPAKTEDERGFEKEEIEAANEPCSVSPKSSPSMAAGERVTSVGQLALLPVPALDERQLVDETAPESDTETEAAGFAKSGINYYDAIRRQEDDDSDDEVEDFPSSANASNSKAKGKVLFAPKLLPRGFTPLSDRSKEHPRSRSAPRGGGSILDNKNIDATRPGGIAVSDSATDEWKDPELAAGLLAIAEIKQAIREETRPTSKMPADHSSTVNVLPGVKVSQEPKEAAYDSESSNAIDEPIKPRVTVKNLAPLEPIESFSTDGSDSITRIERELLRPVARGVAVTRAAKGSDTPEIAAPPTAQAASLVPVATTMKSDPKSGVTNDRTHSVLETSPTVVKAAESNFNPVEKVDASVKPEMKADASVQPEAKAAETIAAVSKPKINADATSKPVTRTDAPSQPVKTTQKKPTVQIDSLDVSMHTYMSSAEMYSAGSVVSAHDNMSVYTSITGVSAMTQSSRVRRPGAAKERLAKAKQTEGTPSRRGWHESIKAVAESSNRVWDPKLGWIDYKQPEEPGEEPTVRSEKIRIDLEKSLKHKNVGTQDDANTSDSKAPPIPFPNEWEADRRQMLEEDSAVDNGALKPLHEKSLAIVAPVSPPSTATSPKAKGWIESMRMASAAIGAQGQSWTPERGWQIVRAGTSVGDGTDVTDGGSTTASELGPSVRVDEPDDQVPSPPSSSRRLGTDTPVEPPRTPAPASVPTQDKKLNQWIAKEEHKPRAERSTESSDKAVAPAKVLDEKYMQLGDTGSVRSFVKDVRKGPPRDPRSSSSLQPSKKGHAADNYISEDDDDDDQTPLLNDTASFPSMSMTESLMSPAVEVVKQKVDQSDLDLFQQEESPLRSVVQRVHKTQSTTPGFPAPISPGRISSSGSTGQRSGPVDLDEALDEHNVSTGPVDLDEEFEEKPAGNNEATEWENEVEEDGRNFDLAESSSGYTKPVPRLNRSKRDTSPVKVRKDSDFLFSTRDTPLPVSELKAAPVTPDEGRPLKSNLLPPRQLNFDANQSRSSISGSGLPKTNAVKTDPPAARHLGSRSPSGTYLPSVQSKLHQWEGRAGKPDEALSDAASDGSAELEAIADRKQASKLSASANKFRQMQTQKIAEKSNTSSMATHRQLPVAPSTNVLPVPASQRSTDDDSLFEFPAQAGFSLGIAGAESAAQRRRESPVENVSSDSDRDVSEAYGPLPGERTSFFKRLVECSAPIMPPLKQACGRPSDSAPSEVAYVEPSRTSITSDSATRFVKPSDSKPNNSAPKLAAPPQNDRANDPPRPQSAPRTQSRGRDEVRGTSSVVSEDFGAKTAYLEAIAAKTAVSKPRRSSSRRRSRSVSGSSVVSNTSSQHSEKWKAFLERKKAGMVSPPKSRAATDVSRAAEKYAAEKVEEMMLMMSTKHKAADYRYARENQLAGTMERSSTNASEASSEDWRQKRSESVKAAEDLAAARVEAMMAALSGNHHLDEGEI